MSFFGVDKVMCLGSLVTVLEAALLVIELFAVCVESYVAV